MDSRLEKLFYIEWAWIAVGHVNMYEAILPRDWYARFEAYWPRFAYILSFTAISYEESNQQKTRLI